METFAMAEDVRVCPESFLPAGPSLLYSVDEKPSWGQSFILGIQHVVTSTTAALSFPLILGSTLCILNSDPAIDPIVATVIFVCGISTLLQVHLGVRLPLVQGPNLVLAACFHSYLQLPMSKCPSEADLYSMGPENRTIEWHDRMQETQGAVISTSVLQMIVGYSGLVGLFARFLSPVVIAPTVTLLGLSMIPVVAEKASDNWYIALSSIVLLGILWQYMNAVKVPLLWYSAEKGWHCEWCLTIQLRPVLLCIIPVSIVCWALTYNEILREVPNRINLDTPWFNFPHPLQWGLPRFTANSIASAIAVNVVSTVASVGNYYSCAALCDRGPPPSSAISRGIGMEGFCTLIAGLFGIGTGIDTMTSDVGAIGITKVGNRRVITMGALVMVLVSIFPHLRWVLYLIPISVVGGLMCGMCSVVTAVGLSHLQYVNMNCRRNLFVLGIGFFFSLLIPHWIKANENSGLLTGYEVPDLIIRHILSSPVLLVFTLTFFLDNLLPGNAKDRGISKWIRCGRDRNGYSNNRNASNIDETTYACPQLFCTCHSRVILYCLTKVQFL